MRAEIPLQGLEIFLRKLLSHSLLSTDDQAAILSLPHGVRHFEPNTYILREGDRSGICPILCAGFAYRQKLTHEGGRQIVALKNPRRCARFPIYVCAHDRS